MAKEVDPFAIFNKFDKEKEEKKKEVEKKKKENSIIQYIDTDSKIEDQYLKEDTRRKAFIDIISVQRTTQFLSYMGETDPKKTWIYGFIKERFPEYKYNLFTILRLFGVLGKYKESEDTLSYGGVKIKPIIYNRELNFPHLNQEYLYQYLVGYDRSRQLSKQSKVIDHESYTSSNLEQMTKADTKNFKIYESKSVQVISRLEQYFNFLKERGYYDEDKQITDEDILQLIPYKMRGGRKIYLDTSTLEQSDMLIFSKNTISTGLLQMTKEGAFNDAIIPIHKEEETLNYVLGIDSWTTIVTKPIKEDNIWYVRGAYIDIFGRLLLGQIVIQKPSFGVEQEKVAQQFMRRNLLKNMYKIFRSGKIDEVREGISQLKKGSDYYLENKPVENYLEVEREGVIDKQQDKMMIEDEREELKRYQIELPVENLNPKKKMEILESEEEINEKKGNQMNEEKKEEDNFDDILNQMD